MARHALLRSQLLDRYGFEADMEHFAIFGSCPKCRSKLTRPTEEQPTHGR